MIINTPDARRLGRTDHPSNSSRRHRANFARAAVFAEFGRAAFALDQGDFSDREPWEAPMLSPTARFR